MSRTGTFLVFDALLDHREWRSTVHVDPTYTSQGCSNCNHVSRKNRPNQSTFQCTSCGFAEHADVNAARNIAKRGVAGWAAVSLPNTA